MTSYNFYGAIGILCVRHWLTQQKGCAVPKFTKLALYSFATHLLPHTKLIHRGPQHHHRGSHSGLTQGYNCIQYKVGVHIVLAVLLHADSTSAFNLYVWCITYMLEAAINKPEMQQTT